MYRTTAASAARRLTHSRSQAAARVALVAAILLGGVRIADAQAASEQKTADTPAPQEQRPRWELTLPTGTVVPVAAQRDAIKRGHLTAVQVSYVVRPDLAITSTVGWARSRDVASIGAPKLDVFTYDLGAEVRAPRWRAGKSITFSPFAGGGAGARSYNYRDLEVDARHNVGAYVGGGGEIGFRRVRVRLEVRDYVTGFKPLAGPGTTQARNDVVVMTGLHFTRR
jgi:hypothetical protein